MTAIAANATVFLLADGVVAGSTLSTTGGTAWIDPTQPLHEGMAITARQSNADGASGDSLHAVPVVADPDPLPTVVFDSPLTTCMETFRLSALLPGAKVEVTQQGGFVSSFVARETSALAAVETNGPLKPGFGLSAIQSLMNSAGATITSDASSSLPLAPIGRESAVPAPTIVEPLVACRTTFDAAKIIPSASITVENEGHQFSVPGLAPNVHVWGVPPMREGSFVAHQGFPRCGITSPATTLTVGPATTPPPPFLASMSCPQNRRIKVGNLIPGATVTVLQVRSVDLATPPESMMTPIGEAIANAAEEEFEISSDVPTFTPEGVLITFSVRQTLCGLTSPRSADYGFGAPMDADKVPSITQPVYECTRSITLTETTPGSLVQLLDTGTGQPIADPMLIHGWNATIPLWFPLPAGRTIIARLFGCDRERDSSGVPVLNVPNPMPVPAITAPVRPLSSMVAVTGCIPGARIHLLVNGIVRTSVDTLATTATIPTGPLQLQRDDGLFAVQTLCTHGSRMEGIPTPVTLGSMDVVVSHTTIARGSTTTLTVAATDNDTHEPILGAKVLLNGQTVGVTGTPFACTPQPGDASLSGVVREPIAHHDATFSIALADQAPPPTSSFLHLNIGFIPEQLQIESAKWTIRPMWNTAVLTASGANTVVAIPHAPSGTKDPRVSIVVETVWNIGGMINGVSLSPGTISGFLDPNPTRIPWTNTERTAAWVPSISLVNTPGGIKAVVTAQYAGTE